MEQGVFAEGGSNLGVDACFDVAVDSCVSTASFVGADVHADIDDACMSLDVDADK